ncbi:MAG: gamma-glutamyl-gamma-aminobutyrate hydrolase family protein [Firmicutes bacterium]|nr:gamma-glutamyl-gamma-aminobutyrate hydrolase family protein [Bacillota bacterium]
MVLIGVVSTGDPLARQIFRGDYGKAVRRAGGIPVFLTWKPKHAAFWAKHLNGFLFTGGGDPDPKYYGQAMLPQCGATNASRDEFELALLKAVISAGKPILGICRGEQILNVALGGTLIQDIPSQRPEAAAENHRDNDHRRNPSHPARVLPGTFLHSLFGCEELLTNSIHHQAVDTLAPGMRVCALSPAGIVEGIEAEDGRFLLGLQWHPEALAAADERMRRPFGALVEACRKTN